MKSYSVSDASVIDDLDICNIFAYFRGQLNYGDIRNLVVPLSFRHRTVGIIECAIQFSQRAFLGVEC